jgi:hypothetical protein
MTYSYGAISDAGKMWIDDLMGSAPESGFPDLDPSSMTEIERDTLAAYLAAEDGSLSPEDMEFSSRVAAEIENLEAEESNLI